MVMGRCKEYWGSVTIVRMCASHQGGVMGIIRICQFYGEV